MKRSQAKPKQSDEKVPSDLIDRADDLAPSARETYAQGRERVQRGVESIRSAAEKAMREAQESTRRAPPRAQPRPAHLDERVLEYAEVLAHAVDTFGSRTRANAWLNRPSRIFNNQSPLQVLTQDPAAVEEELVRIDHGMFA